MKLSFILAWNLIGCFLASESAAQGSVPEEARLLRFPHIQGDKVAFVYGGDIWTNSSSGGAARRVTSFDQGLEIFPRISWDGEWIAFSGEYSGSRQVFVVPYSGGQPRQLTFYPDVGRMPPRGGFDNLTFDWTRDGRILFRSNRTPYGERIGTYFLVDPKKGGLPRSLGIPEGGPASFSPDGTKLAFDIISREWRTWKRYKAGRAQDVWIYDLEVHTIEQITDFEGTDNHPMWLGDRIYFTSDRTGTLNLYAYDLGTKETRAITDFTDFDVLFPSRGQGGLIFERGGFLYVMDAGTEKVRKLTIHLADDRPWKRARWIEGPGNTQSYAASPSAKRVAVEARGEVFSVPASKGQPKNLTRSPGRRERGVCWSPDGKTISYLAEVGDDYELFLLDPKTGEETQATQGTGSWIVGHSWSPDSQRIQFTDRAQRLMVLEVESKTLTELDRSREGMIDSPSWSGDGSYLTYSKDGVNGFRSVWVCPTDRSEPVQVTSDRFNDYGACFDPGGDYLYFVSDRDFVYGDLDFESRIYAFLLTKEAASPVVLEEDVEEEPKAKGAPQDAAEGDDPDSASAEAGEGSDEKDEKDEEKEPVVEPDFRIDFEGLSDRLVVLPLPAGRYFNLEGIEGGLLYDDGSGLKKYSLEDRESKTVLEGVHGYQVSGSGKQLVYRNGRDLCVAKLAPDQKAGADPIPLDRVSVRIDPGTEWAQIYQDAWRVMRDWFYDPGMHAVDWLAMREKYQPLVLHVAHRDDLDFILGELIGELNCGHTYVTSGDAERVPRVAAGVLGCEFEADQGRYRISKIFKGENWNEETRSPLTEPGVDVAEGDFLLAIDGEQLLAGDNPYRLLENKAGRQVTLLVSDTPDPDGAREVLVRPSSSELQLRYLAWVRHNRELVENLSGGRIGYVHVPDTADSGHRELWKEYRPQVRVRAAMIIDDRYNGGGHVPFDMVRSLGMPTLNYWARRHSELDTTPEFAFDGPMAMLINGYSSSGGDCFPYYFRKLGLGPLIGAKTWGGLVGYSGSPRMVDGGGLAVPSFAFVNTEGQWDVEYFGVAPDRPVFDDPTVIRTGRDPSIEDAVKYLLGELEKQPTPARPAVPPGPVRDR
ncbi:MAG: PDZ domain-containing protein [Planctomycetota bacterium]